MRERLHHEEFLNNTGQNKKKKKINKKCQHVDYEQCKRVIYLIMKGASTRNIIRDMEISGRTIRRISKQYQQNGRFIKAAAIRNSNRKRSISQRKVNQMISTKKAVQEIVRSNCCLTLAGMKQQLQKRGIRRQTSSIHKYLKELKYSRKKLRKVPIERNTKQKLVYRQKYCQMISQIPLENLIFLDQTAFNQHTGNSFGWAPKGQEPAVHVPAQKKKCVSLLAAISIKGFEATKIIRGPISNKHICQFLEHYLDHLQPQQVLVLDNARVHHAATVKEKIAELKRPVRYLPAYTPQLNPIQNVFSEIKSQFAKKRYQAEMKVDEVQCLIQQSVKNMRTKSFQKYFQRYSQWVKKGMAGELFI